MANTEITLTAASLELFLEFAEDANNWSGTPLVTVTPAQRGNLTHLKKAELLTTFDYDGFDWVRFTDKGIALAAEHGIDLSWVAVA